MEALHFWPRGVDNFYRKTYSVVCTSTPEVREDWLKDVKYIVNKSFPRNDDN